MRRAGRWSLAGAQPTTALFRTAAADDAVARGRLSSATAIPLRD
jgi:hypothetical protein